MTDLDDLFSNTILAVSNEDWSKELTSFNRDKDESLTYWVQVDKTFPNYQRAKEIPKNLHEALTASEVNNLTVSNFIFRKCNELLLTESDFLALQDEDKNQLEGYHYPLY